MAQYYTLDEASKLLGLKPDEFRKRLATEWKTLRRFPDGATLRFQSRDIDELARRVRGSGEAEAHADAPLKLADDAPAGKPKADDAIFVEPSSSDDFVPLAMDDPAAPAKPKTGSDSDVKLEKTAGGSVRATSQSDDATDLLEPVGDRKQDSKTFDIKSDATKKTKRNQATSEFDLTLNTDSDDFDLELGDDSDEVPVGQRTTKKRPGDSGINLQDPADSGISLEKESSEFELELEPGMAGPKTDPVRRDGPKTDPLKKKAAAKTDDSDSEFELTLDEGSDSAVTAFDNDEQKDIFETDFELPAIDDSSSEVKEGTDSGLEDSDFDLAADDGTGEDSASEVVAIEEDETAEDDLEPIDDEEVESRAAASAMVAAPTAWGPLPIIALVPCTAVMFMVAMMGFELVRSMWGHNTRTTVPGVFVKAVASMFGEVKE